MIMIIYCTFTHYKTMQSIHMDIIRKDISNWKQNGYIVNVFCACTLCNLDNFCKSCNYTAIDFKSLDGKCSIGLRLKNLVLYRIYFISPTKYWSYVDLNDNMIIRNKNLYEKNITEYNDLINFLRNDFIMNKQNSDDIDKILDTYFEGLSKLESIRNLFNNTQKDEEIIIEI